MIADRAEIRRRDLLKLFAGGALLAQAGCFEPPGDPVLPYVAVPPSVRPDAPVFYATTMTLDGYGTGLLAETYQGRPIKLEGNPAHPASLGATLPVHQASILDLYDPQRVRAPSLGGVPVAWAQVAATLASAPHPLWVVLPPHGSAVIAALVDRIRERRPDARIVSDGAHDRRAVYRGTALAYGAPYQLQLALDRADVVVALDADVLGGGPMAARWAHDWAERRRLSRPGDDPGRLYVVEPAPTPTGTVADHRLPAPAGDVAGIALLLAAEIAARGVSLLALPPALRARVPAPPEVTAWVAAAADDLLARRGAGLVVAGDRQPAAVHALARWIDEALGNAARTSRLTAPVLADPLGAPTLADLAAAIDAREVSTVVIIDATPVYTAPRALDLARRLARVPVTVHCTVYADETSAACRWVVPLAHYLEAWGDARAWDGTASFVQPTIRPLHGAWSTIELLALLAGIEAPRGLALLRERWTPALGDGFDAALAAGVIPGTGAAPVAAELADPVPLLDGLAAAIPARRDGIEVAVAPSPAIHDGRFAGNAWLQELPHPITKQTWGNAAMASPATLARLGAAEGELLAIEVAGRRVDAPAIAVPGHADGAITLELGYGRRVPELAIADRVGADAYALLDRGGDPIVAGASVQATGRRTLLARTQPTLSPHGREIALQADLASYRANPDFTIEHRRLLPSLLDPPQREDVLQWAMTIDTMICTGCSSCVVACQAENNIPTVGPEGVANGREMHWLRIDSYVDHGRYVHQPMLCQHCEKAPCEYVCPVNATVHSPDGLNEMVYNRCIGTRFCSNNCPYKVRRFNFFAYHEPPSPTALQHNPEVTVRARGVMEKCTYCVQRIRAAELRARVEDRPIRPGEVVTACQQACPTGAIRFGALSHTGTAMVQWRRQPRAYAVLHELGTRPRTIYLASIVNPHRSLVR